MKFVVLTVLAFAAVAQAKIDWSTVKPKHLTVDPIRKAAQPKIVGGAEAQRHSYPHQVAVISGGAFCGGSIIGPRLILTAAHCVDGASNSEVIVGAHNVQQEEDTQQVLSSSRIEIHPGWESWSLKNDLALVHLSSSIQLDGKTAKIVQLNHDDSSLDGDEAHVSGWGRPSDSSNSISPVLRYTIENIISNNRCTQDFGGYITENIVCLDGTRGKGSCNGDSGGPLLITRGGERVQAGIVSFGSGAGCEAGYASAYTRVSKYTSWIENRL